MQTSQVIQTPQIIQQGSQVINTVSYQQPGIPPIVKNKPPRPISASKTFVIPEFENRLKERGEVEVDN